jgi:S-DNA-T family DNA segregation ATPase FtsK/SpoIIIE
VNGLAVKKKKEKARHKLYHEFIGVIVFAFGIFTGISIYSEASGLLGQSLGSFFFGLFGLAAYAVPLLFIIAGIMTIAAVKKKPRTGKIATYVVMIWSIISVIHVFALQKIVLDKGYLFYIGSSYEYGSSARQGGGALGSLLVYPANLLLDTLGAYILFFTAILICIMILTNMSLKKIGMGIGAAGKTTVEKIKTGAQEMRAERERNKRLFIDEIEEEQPYEPDESEFHRPMPIPKQELYKPNVKNADAYRKEPLREPHRYNPEEEEQEDEHNRFLAQEKYVKRQPPRHEPEEPEAEPEEDEDFGDTLQSHEHAQGEKPKKTYIVPPVSILEAVSIKRPKRSGSDDVKKSAFILEDTLRSFGITATVVNISRGPVVTRYELQPAPGVKVSRIVNLSDDIALNLAAPRVRIEAPIPGKAAIGIEVPNGEIDTVFIRDLLSTEEFKKKPSPLVFALGQDLAGKNVYADIATMPHMLIAGATGSGKSVCINTLIASILLKTTPEDVRMIMIDPKVVELSVYNNIPHLLVPVVTDPKKAAGALNWAVQEMTSRYKTFAEKGARDIKKYNEALVAEGAERIPSILVIIDELADLMIVAQNDVEDAICRIAQLGRACGIHLVIATQRPSVDVITGVIKANIPSRIAFAVSSQVDSRTILDMAGAEKLLGKGDMLYYPIGYPKPVRLQGAFINDKEVEIITDFLKEKTESQYDEGVIEGISGGGTVKSGGSEDSECDELLPKSIEIGMEYGQISISMLQRRLRVGYARAARLIDEMEVRGIVSAFEGSKPRQMLITRDEYETMFDQEEL